MIGITAGGFVVDLELLAGAIFILTAGVYYLECAMRAAVLVEYQHPDLGPVQSPVELAWYYRPAEVFLRQIINARRKRSPWRT